MKGIGERLKQVRKKIGLNQGKFAESIKISQSMLSGIESEREVFSDRNIKLICHEFNINETWLRTGEGEMFMPKSKYQSPFEQEIDGMEFLTPNEIAFISDYRLLTEPNKKVAKTMVKSLLSSQAETEANHEPRDPPGIGPRIDDGQAG